MTSDDAGVAEAGDVGCDDIVGSNFCAPTLRVGFELTAMLLGLISGENRAVEAPDLPVHLKIRASTGPAQVSPR